MVIIEKNNDDKIINQQLSSIPSYYEEKVKQRKEAELQKDTDLKEIFIKALNFYIENYPKSFQKRPIVWNEKKKDFHINENILLKETLERSSIEELYQMEIIIKYSLDERNYKRVPTRNRFNELRGKIIKLIPGGREAMEIKALQEELQITDMKIKELELCKKEKVIEFKRNRNELIEEIESKIPKEPSEAIIKFKCPYCDDKKLNRGGLGSHIKHVHGDIKYELYKSIPDEELINETK